MEFCVEFKTLLQKRQLCNCNVASHEHVCRGLPIGSKAANTGIQQLETVSAKNV